MSLAGVLRRRLGALNWGSQGPGWVPPPTPSRMRMSLFTLVHLCLADKKEPLSWFQFVFLSSLVRGRPFGLITGQ